MRGGLLLPLALLLFLSAPALAQYCPVEKVPTETQLYVDRNEADGVIAATATLSAIDLTTKASAPLPKEVIIFQECAVGNFSSGCPAYAHVCAAIPNDYWFCESKCCISHIARATDADGKASVVFPLTENTTVIAVYLGSTIYLPSNSTGSFLYPPMFGALDIGACFPLLLVLGLLMLSMSAMGKSPIGAFDFSALHAPRARQRGPTAMVFSTGSVATAIKGSKEGREKYKQQKEADKARKEGKVAEGVKKDNDALAKGQIREIKDDKGNGTGKFVVTDKGKSEGYQGKKTGEMVVTEAGRAVGLQVKREGNTFLATTTESRKKAAEDMQKGRGFLGAMGGAGLSILGAGWARNLGRAAERGGKSARAEDNLKEMVDKGLIKWESKMEKDPATGKDVDKGKFVSVDGNTGIQALADRYSNEVKVRGGVLNFAGSAAKGFGKIAGAATDFPLRTVTFGNVGTTGGKISLVRIVGGAIKGVNKGAKAVGKGLSAVDDKLGHVPSIVGKDTLIVAKTVIQKEKDPHFVGAKVLGLNVGLGFGGTVDDYNKYAWDPTGITNRALEADFNSKLMQQYESIRRANQNLDDVSSELQFRRLQVDQSDGLLEVKNNEVVLSELGKKQLKGLIEERQSQEFEPKRQGEESHGHFDYSLTEQGKNDERAKSVWAIVYGKGSGGVSSLSYRTLTGIEGIHTKLNNNEEVRVSRNENGVSYGFEVSGFGISRTGRVTLSGSQLYSEAPETSRTTAKVLNALNWIGGPEIAMGLIISSTTRMGPINPTAGVLDFYSMRFGRIEQVGAMRSSSGGGFQPATYEERNAIAAKAETDRAVEVLDKDPSKWSAYDIQALGTSGMVTTEQMDALRHSLPFRSSGLSIEGEKLEKIGDILGDFRTEFDSVEFKQKLMDTEHGAGLSEQQATMILTYISKGSRREGLSAISEIKPGESFDQAIHTKSERGSNVDEYSNGMDLLKELKKENKANENVVRVLNLTGGSVDLASERAQWVAERGNELAQQRAQVENRIENTEARIQALVDEIPSLDTPQGPKNINELQRNLGQIDELKTQLAENEQRTGKLVEGFRELNKTQQEDGERGIGASSQEPLERTGQSAAEKEISFEQRLENVRGYSELMENISQNLASDNVMRLRQRKYSEDYWEYG